LHVCEMHLNQLDRLEYKKLREAGTGSMGFLHDADLRQALHDPVAQQETAAHELPALCLALLHEKPEVRITAAFRLMGLGSNARPAVGALRDALRDADERVAKAARIALEYIESKSEPPPLV